MREKDREWVCRLRVRCHESPLPEFVERMLEIHRGMKQIRISATAT